MYILKHKDIEVMSFEYDSKIKNCKILNKEHLPMFFIDKYSLEDNMTEWMMTRCIPQSRKFYDRLIKSFDTNDIMMIPLVTGGISLTDCYWIIESTSNKTWNEVNYFDNAFDSMLDRIYLSPQFGLSRSDRINLTKILNPSITAQGSLPKVWRIKDNKRILIKGNMNSSECSNEILASKLLNSPINELTNVTDCKYAIYNEYIDEQLNMKLCYSDNFIFNNEDFISADDLFSYHKWNLKDINEDSVEELINISEKHISGLREQIDFIRVFDYLICNEDRHWNNFGFIRDAETLEFKRLAPIFDNGYSFFCDYNKEDERLKYTRGVTSHLDNIKLKDALALIKTDTSKYLDLNHLRSLNINLDFMSNERLIAYRNYFDDAVEYLIYNNYIK